MQIQKLTDREHILKRPSMYIGSISNEPTESFTFDGQSLKLTTKTINPGLIKIINEVIDNSIDAIIKTQKGNRIYVDIDNQKITVKDNSTGFPITGTFDENEPTVIALGNARAGSNFNDEENIGQMGTNGVGAFCTNCFSDEFTVITENKQHKLKATWNSGTLKEIKELKSFLSGTEVEFVPTLSRFNLTIITDEIKNEIKTRLTCLAYTYPKIRFFFNQEELNAPKLLVEWLEVNEDPYIHHKSDDYEVFVIARNQSTTNFSFVNGLNVKDGGTHLDVIGGDISKGFGDLRGFGDVSKSDVLNTLQLVFVGTGFKNLRFNSQTKEKITNSTKETREYLGDLSALVKKVVSNKEIREFIKATKDSRELRASKSKLNQVKKAKIKSDKFLDSQVSRDYLMIVEGDSALGGLLPALGRKHIAYYALKGKPLNSWTCSTQKLTANKELSELLAVIASSDFKKIVLATDQDLDGFHIRGLLMGFVRKYLPEYLDKLCILQTPVKGVYKNGQILRWAFNVTDELEIKKGEYAQYIKGLGSFDRDDLKFVIDNSGLDSLLVPVELNDDSILEDWLGNDSQKRKDYILANDFSIAKA